MKNKHQLPIGIGISSILSIFVILCLLTFAVLSLVSANADYKLVKKTALILMKSMKLKIQRTN